MEESTATCDGYRHEMVVEAANSLKAKINTCPQIGIICGSGLSGLGEDVENPIVVKYDDIPHFSDTTAPGHKGQLVFGKLGSKDVMCMQGRFHAYEGHPAWKIALPLRVMKLLGVKIVLITNSAGGLNRSYNVGDFMLIKDHISFPGLAGYNPLRGANDEAFGPRFPAVSPAFVKELRCLFKITVAELGYKDITHEGVYCNVAGPSFETISELRMLLQIGGDVVGMSTAQEVIAAAHCGLQVVACSLVTNRCVMEYDSTEAPNEEEVLETAAKRADDMKTIVKKFLEKI